MTQKFFFFTKIASDSKTNTEFNKLIQFFTRNGLLSSSNNHQIKFFVKFDKSKFSDIWDDNPIRFINKVYDKAQVKPISGISYKHIPEEVIKTVLPSSSI